MRRLLIVLVWCAVGSLAAGCTFVQRASVDSGGGDPDEASRNPELSADGRVVAANDEPVIEEGGQAGTEL